MPSMCTPQHASEFKRSGPSVRSPPALYNTLQRLLRLHYTHLLVSYDARSAQESDCQHLSGEN
eukprot:20460-Eustigmatos_ZCMA.PRE.1